MGITILLKKTTPQAFHTSLFIAFRTLSKTLAKHPKVRFLSSPLKNPGSPKVFRISGQFLWPSVAPMLARCMADRGDCISRRAPQIESFIESRESPKHWGFACPRLVPIHTRRGGRIRTICVIF
jgi:hypothetical protein